ncbi:hypothetical protein F5Y18DRAFT_384915 [Xylariaceae sp. FL1019]|nr:hypothetical protein F5Y18DRAFT_384915 [Xylariaceae sp. FL1019]
MIGNLNQVSIAAHSRTLLQVYKVLFYPNISSASRLNPRSQVAIRLISRHIALGAHLFNIRDTMANENVSNDDGYEEVPLHRVRPFGSGLKRKRVVFVPASKDSQNQDGTASSKPSPSVSDMYLSLVLPGKAAESAAPDETIAIERSICEICQLPTDTGSAVAATSTSSSRPHEASIAHQVCLSHSHPPSAVDRSRMGLAVLQSQGWDPDARQGLGASREGMQFPIKAKPKNDTLGLGVRVPKGIATQKQEAKVQKIGAKKARKLAAEDKERHEQLRRQFYGNEDVERYLGRQ